jgi:signal transduction histidine kinase
MNETGKFLKKYRWLLSALIVLALAISGKTILLHNIRPEQIAHEVFQVFKGKEILLQNKIDEAVGLLANITNRESLWKLSDDRLFNKDGLAICIYKNDTLVFWTSSLVTFPERNGSRTKNAGIRKLPTGWFYAESRSSGEYRIDGFIMIKRTFPYKNKYIKSSFQHGFNLPDDYEIGESRSTGSIDITRENGEFIFSILDNDDRTFTKNNAIFLALLYLIFTLLFLTHINEWLQKSGRISSLVKTIIVILFAGIFYFIVNQLKIPEAIFSLELFSPNIFALGSWLPSLGEFAFLSILMFHVAQSFFRFHEFHRIKANRFRLTDYLPYLFFGLYFAFSVFLFISLMNNSNISMEMLANLRISAINILAFSCIALQFLGLIIILVRMRCIYDSENRLLFVSYSVGAAFIFILILNLLNLNTTYYSLIYLLFVAILTTLVDTSKIVQYRLTVLLVFAVISAMYLNLTAHIQLDSKKEKEQRLWAVNLASERDPAAEIFLSEFESNVKTDTLILKYLQPPYHDLANYLTNNYFTGFWRNYEMQVTPCALHDSVLIEEEGKSYPCTEFFDNLKITMGLLIPGSNFYFMNQLNGRISYLGQLNFDKPHVYQPLSVFIELYSKITPEGKGYPQLLLDELASKKSRENGFSYAKYFGGRLVDRGGEYQYNLKPTIEMDPTKEFNYFKQNGYSHCIYHRSGDNFVVVSYAENTLLKMIGTFPYLFLLFYILGFLWIMLNRKKIGFGRKKADFRDKIQITLILTLFGTLFIIGLGLIIYNYNEFRITLKQNLEEKIRAISSELELRIGNTTQLASIRENLNSQLIEISDITWSDINLYDTTGQLASTSRKEIFERGLTSQTMDPQAFRALALNEKAIFLHNEKLGNMDFFSAYSPVFNMFDQLVGYVNLPYFSRQDDFTKEVSGFIVAFSNIYIFLILISLLVALFISNKLTAPLLRIEENLKGIELGKENAKIDYQGEDEIGRLAKEYNKKVDELAESAALLAKSERESAWKEMARQIAHEINNPLTPMKLNIQYLQRIKEQDNKKFDEYFKRVTKTVIDQIDVLSSIASAFSDFAKISGFRNEPVDLSEKIREVAFLFGNSPETKIELLLPEEKKIVVMGDKDHLSRALINLIKNGMQAIPSEQAGLVRIELEQLEDYARITVTDNGTGIASEIHDRLFEPSFTTKSSGMGLGLAITKRIVENMKGEIRFQTSPGNGTSFIVELPLAED